MKRRLALFSVTLATMLHAEQIKEIKYENLLKLSPKIAKENNDLKVGDELDIKKVTNTIKKFYGFGYFDDISVHNKNGILTFDFKEKPSIAALNVEGYKTRDEDIKSLYRIMGLRKGSMYSKKRVQKAKKRLLKELEREGYVNSVVEIEIEKINKNSISLTFNVNKGDEIIIKKVNYFGAKNLDEDDFEDVTANKEEDYVSWWFGQNDGVLDKEQLPYDNVRMRDLYFENGYLDAVVQKPFMTVDFTSNDATLDFFIKEGQVYSVNNITIYVDSTIIDPEKLYENLKLKKGKTFNIAKLRKDSDFIKTSVADLGYAFTDVRFDIKKDEVNKKADIIFNVIPGKKVYINDVKISGNTNTLDRVIRRNVYLAPGDLYSLTDYKDSINKLKRTGFFDDVKIKQQRLTDTTMDLVVEVQEASTGAITLSGGYGSYDGLLISGSVNNKNIFGSGLALGFSVDKSKRKNNFKVSLKNPAIRDSKYNGEFEVHRNTSEIEYTDYDLDKQSVGFSVGVGKEIVRNLYGGLRYRLDNIEETYSTEKSGITLPVDQEYLLSSITPYVNFNNTDDFYLPRTGYIAGVSTEIAGLGGDARYLNNSAYLKYFHSLEDLIDTDIIFRFKSRIKYLIDTGFISQGTTYYLGGPSSLRGYKSYAFGPDDARTDKPFKRFWANSFELSFPLIPKAKMRWGLFYDYGMIGQETYNEIKRSGTGALIEWISPVGPLQFIFSKAIDAEAGDETSSFEFSLGTKF